MNLTRSLTYANIFHKHHIWLTLLNAGGNRNSTGSRTRPITQPTRDLGVRQAISGSRDRFGDHFRTSFQKHARVLDHGSECMAIAPSCCKELVKLIRNFNAILIKQIYSSQKTLTSHRNTCRRRIHTLVFHHHYNVYPKSYRLRTYAREHARWHYCTTPVYCGGICQ